MSIKNQRQLENTLQKLAELEKLFAETKANPESNPLVQELALRSYKQTINQLKEEIIRYRAHATTTQGKVD